MSEQALKKLFSGKEMDKYVFRETVQVLEEHLLALPKVTLRNDPITPLRHWYTLDLYCREITIPAKFVLTTAIHKTEHIAVISKGKCIVASEKGIEVIEAPHTMVTKIGTKRAIYVIEELVWNTIHAMQVTTPEEAEKLAEFSSFKEYDDFMRGKE